MFTANEAVIRVETAEKYKKKKTTTVFRACTLRAVISDGSGLEGGATVINVRVNFLPPFLSPLPPPLPLNKNDVPDPGPVVWYDVLREGKEKPCWGDVPRFQAFREIASRCSGLEKITLETTPRTLRHF